MGQAWVVAPGAQAGGRSGGKGTGGNVAMLATVCGGWNSSQALDARA